MRVVAVPHGVHMQLKERRERLQQGARTRAQLREQPTMRQLKQLLPSRPAAVASSLLSQLLRLLNIECPQTRVAGLCCNM